MNKIKILLSTLSILLIVMVSCGDKKSNVDFSLKLSTYNSSIGESLRYVIKDSRLKITSNCDFEDCEKKLVYNYKFSSKDYTDFIEFIHGSGLDTLKNKYLGEGLDGRKIHINVASELIKAKKIRVKNFSHPGIEKILNSVNQFITEDSLKIKNLSNGSN